MYDIQFNEAEHEYRVDGKVWPSVTTILESGGLIDYSKLSDKVREEALERGTYVHLACHILDTDELDPDTIDPAIMPYVDAYKQFKEDGKFKVIESEKIDINRELKYAGTYDKLGTMYGEQTPILLDIKTGGMPAWTRLQLSAYANFHDTPAISARYGLLLKKTGKYSLHGPWIDGDFEVFKACLRIQRWKARYM